ncbi:MAG: corrinoid protein [Rhodothermia bacterium]|nr:MAG: corrinoid protein [Rhodothermia bacterium]
MSDQLGLLNDMRLSILDGDAEVSRQLAERALADGLEPLTAIEEGFVPGIHEVGVLWEEGEYFLPELVTAAEALQSAMAVFQPFLGDKVSVTESGRAVIGTVAGDIHDIGMTLVGTMLAAHGFTILDIGADAPLETFIEKAREVDADLVCASALLTTTMTRQRDLASMLAKSGIRAKLMVGGAPVSAEWANEIGAHGYADNAVHAVNVAKELIRG